MHVSALLKGRRNSRGNSHVDTKRGPRGAPIPPTSCALLNSPAWISALYGGVQLPEVPMTEVVIWAAPSALAALVTLSFVQLLSGW
jgi:hypothetical protein